MSNQDQTPLFTGLVKHARKNPIQFHIPGHKKGKGMDPEFRWFIGKNALSIDLINIRPLDDLHQPAGIIQEAQDLAAEAFGAEHTIFSVQGTSTAIMTMIMSVCHPGEKIIAPRNVHKSIMSGIIFSGAHPIFLHPEMDLVYGIAHGITPKSVEEALEQHPDAKAVLVIHPTYFGTASDLKKIVKVAHARGVPVLVDEAHGSHVHFHPKLPLSAMQAGADMAASSMHKLGGSMTQSSVLNIQGNRISLSRVQAISSMLSTTSTSYLLLASLDVARKRLVTAGKTLLDQAIRLANQARQEINRIEYLTCMGSEIIGQNGVVAYDPTKLVISVKGLGLTGHEVEKWLRERFHIEVELSDLHNILCIVTPSDSKADLQILVYALEELSLHFREQAKALAEEHMPLPQIPQLAATPRDAFYAPTEIVPVAEAEGRVIAEFVMVYPLGIPIFIPGEVISKENVAYAQRNREAGLPVQGSEDPAFLTVRVLK